MVVLVNLSCNSEKYKRRQATINSKIQFALPTNGKEKQANTQRDQASSSLLLVFPNLNDHRQV